MLDANVYRQPPGYSAQANVCCYAVRSSFLDQKLHSRNAIGSHACSLEVSIRVTNDIPLGCRLPLTGTTVNSVQTLKAIDGAPNQSWELVNSSGGGGGGGHYKTTCGTQQLCLTARTHAPPAPPPPPSPPPPPPGPPASKNTLFKPHDLDAAGVCNAGMREISKDLHYAGGCPCFRIPSVVSYGQDVRCAFLAKKCNRGCHWFPRLIA
jgi:hypothetical protein